MQSLRIPARRIWSLTSLSFSCRVSLLFRTPRKRSNRRKKAQDKSQMATLQRTLIRGGVANLARDSHRKPCVLWRWETGSTAATRRMKLGGFSSQRAIAQRQRTTVSPTGLLWTHRARVQPYHISLQKIIYLSQRKIAEKRSNFQIV